ncbi:MAG: PilZ domain-containing protein [Myxococcota bacterium]|nr:PilZ domain-containing protein [Myxococcota bacterium]
MVAEADRRKYRRIETDQVISFAPIESDDRLALSKNLSAGGICFEVVGCEIGFGDLLRLTFNVLDETFVAVGRVTWATDLDALTQEVGLEFVEIDPFALRAIEEASIEP